MAPFLRNAAAGLTARVDQDRVATARSNRFRLVANNALGQQQSLR
jgi:hypothetical protein